MFSAWLYYTLNSTEIEIGKLRDNYIRFCLELYPRIAHHFKNHVHGKKYAHAMQVAHTAPLLGNRSPWQCKHLINFAVFCCYCLGEGNGSPLQYSCLEDPMDGEPW